MCGRFAVTLPPDAVAHLFEALPDNDLPGVPNYNVCPTNQIQVVRGGETGRRLVSMRWGFLPHWYKTATDGPLLINARAETIAEKPAFRAACRERRCLIPATGFYEWTKDGEGNRLPWYISAADGSPVAFAGIWQAWERGGCAPRNHGDRHDRREQRDVANPPPHARHHRPRGLAAVAWRKRQGRGAAYGGGA